ncbi:MAG: iron-containing alcohol dehydrogenase family protein [Bacillota bacterium]|nr:iron-containing alcohol dehydrogenase family protein [Bacillota bacterium]
MRPGNNRIAIPAILEVGKGNLSYLGALVEKSGFSKIVMFLGQGINEMFGEKIRQSFKFQSTKIIKTYESDDIDINNIIKLAFTIPAEADVIVGIGGGKVLDVAKYSCFLKKLPFISVPTSASNDGFSSSGCSLVIEGKRTSVNAIMPYGIIVDIDVIKEAPEKYIYSGIGDLVSKITAVYDWEFEDKSGKAKIEDFAAMIAKKSVNSFVRTEFKSIREDFFVKELVDSLTMSGIAVEIAQTSAPASGSEHLISHALDKIVETPKLHGLQVGVATYLMSKVQEHRYERVTKVFNDTGFFEHVKTHEMRISDFEKAIDLAPSIKPNRYTYIHIEEYREKAKRLLREDEILKSILKND